MTKSGPRIRYLDETAPFGEAEFDMVKAHIQRVQHSSAKSDWRTPPALYQALAAEFPFHVDVAADDINHLCPGGWYGPYGAESDGLKASWSAATCFMNPPYQRGNKKLGIPAEPIEPWLKKAWSESRAGATVVGVLPFNPQTKWFREHVMGHGLIIKEGVFHAAMEVRMLPHRVTFNRPDGTPADNAPGNTCIVVWRPPHGLIWPWQPTFRYWSYR